MSLQKRIYYFDNYVVATVYMVYGRIVPRDSCGITAYRQTLFYSINCYNSLSSSDPQVLSIYIVHRTTPKVGLSHWVLSLSNKGIQGHTSSPVRSQNVLHQQQLLNDLEDNVAMEGSVVQKIEQVLMSLGHWSRFNCRVLIFVKFSG